MTSRLSALKTLAAAYHLDGLNSGVPILHDWLKHRARHHHAKGGSRYYVLCDGANVIGYYSLAAGSILHGVGANLLHNAVLHATKAGEAIGVRAIFVYAISDAAARFYAKHGF